MQNSALKSILLQISFFKWQIIAIMIKNGNLMSKKLLDNLPEVFVSGAKTTLMVSRAFKAGFIRKLASRLYSKNLIDPPEHIVKRNLWQIIGDYFPGGLIADRTALENAPAVDGSVCLVADKEQNIKLPGGITLRSRRGISHLDTDFPFVNGLFISSMARAYLENMLPTRSRSGLLPRTLTKHELEERLDILLRRSGKNVVNKLRDDARLLAPKLALQPEAEALDELIGALLGTRTASLTSSVAKARSIGKPYDPERIILFQSLYTELKNTPPVIRLAKDHSKDGELSLAFFESYFSNFIEGTKFDVEEAANIIFKKIIPSERPEDAHDILGTWQIVSSAYEMNQTPKNFEDLLLLLKRRHANVMSMRKDKKPGEFKEKNNRAGTTLFVSPELAKGTLQKGFEIYQGLETPFQRAVFMMFIISEIHPFVDGNGRIARIMMNAELVSAGEERIITPTVYRNNYLASLKAMSQSRRPNALISVLDFAQKWTSRIEWQDLRSTRVQLEECNAFLDPTDAEEEGKRLKMP